MALTLNSNLMALNATRNLNTHYNNLATSVRRLSSGLRVTTAADDAAGLAIRELMRADIATLNQGVRNANDAISMIQTMDGALGVIDEKLIRMKELAEQAATGTYNSDQRLIIDSEFQAMASEITRIALATDFNGIKLLCNDTANKLYIGVEAPATPDPDPPVDPVTPGDAAVGYWAGFQSPAVEILNGDAITEDTILHYRGYPNTGILGWTGGDAAFSLLTSWSSQGGSAMAGDYTVSYDPGNSSPWSISSTTGTATINSSNASSVDFILRQGLNNFMMTCSIDPAKGGVVPTGPVSITYSFGITYPSNNNGFWFDQKGAYAGMTVTGGGSLMGNTYEIDLDNDGTADVRVSGEYSRDSFGIALTGGSGGGGGGGAAVGEYSDYVTKIHFGTGNDSAEDYYYIYSTDCTAKGLGLDGTRVQTQQKAQESLGEIDGAIIKKDNARAYLGSMQNRLENTISNLAIQSENIQAAESRISDVDVATEMTELVRNQVLASAATAMLAQANSLPQMALSLMQ